MPIKEAERAQMMEKKNHVRALRFLHIFETVIDYRTEQCSRICIYQKHNLLRLVSVQASMFLFILKDRNQQPVCKLNS